MGDQKARPKIGVVILHMGDRPDEFQRAMADVLKQEGVDLDVVVVGNGWRPTNLPDGVRGHFLPKNVGIPEGRNVGARAVSGDYIFYLDDDASIVKTDVLARLATAIEARDKVALVQPRLSDPVTDQAPRRWVPRLIVGRGIGRAGRVAVFSEGVVLIRRSAFEEVGGWPGQFFFGHEGIEVAWQLTHRGWTMWYDPTISVHHPYTEASRHPTHFFTNARNRVWVARRNLPAVLIPPYLMSWAGITAARTRDLDSMRTWASGFAAGVREPAGQRRVISWRTVATLIRIGRPPVV
ncbi:glycosyltransferase family 2 protein [Demetria terragena]|uniref:glycosyltransferase family 2 protein n=1 Tax=Demetria terragena TaxID=63959 RepID=UPI00047787FD|nr:glycosyltransferase [Demetria terragena]